MRNFLRLGQKMSGIDQRQKRPRAFRRIMQRCIQSSGAQGIARFIGQARGANHGVTRMYRDVKTAGGKPFFKGAMTR